MENILLKLKIKFILTSCKFIIPDKFSQKKIENLIGKCGAGDEKCEFTGTLKQLAEHHNCHFKVKQNKVKFCPHCSQTFNDKSELEKHLDLENGTCLKQPYN